MMAARFYEPGVIRLEQVEVPEISSDELLVRNHAVLTCGTDLKMYLRGHRLAKPPLIIGHEFAGTIERVGRDVRGFEVGMNVVSANSAPCMSCYYCRVGQHNLCEHLDEALIGFSSPGAYAEYVRLPGRIVRQSTYKIPQGLSFEEAAFLEPLACVVHGEELAKISPADFVLVIGAGPIGLLVLQAAKAAGASKVFAIEPIEQRRKLARQLGANEVFDPTQSDVGKEIADRTEGLRTNVAFECVGSQSAFDTALRITGRRAMIVMVGMAVKPLEVPFLRLWGHEKEITTCTGYVDEYPTAIALLADRRVMVEPMITGKIKLSELVEKGIQEMIQHPEHHVKILVAP